MMPWVSGLAAGFPLALVLAAARSLLSGQTIGGRGLGRVCGVPLAQGELSFQVGDLLFLFGDLLFRSEEHTSELQSRFDLVCRLLLEKKNKRYRSSRYSTCMYI